MTGPMEQAVREFKAQRDSVARKAPRAMALHASGRAAAEAMRKSKKRCSGSPRVGLAASGSRRRQRSGHGNGSSGIEENE